MIFSAVGGGGGGLLQWLNLPAWKVGDRRFVSSSGNQASKTQIQNNLFVTQQKNKHTLCNMCTEVA